MDGCQESTFVHVVFGDHATDQGRPVVDRLSLPGLLSLQGTNSSRRQKRYARSRILFFGKKPHKSTL